jgi:hypothetical protein
MFLLLPLAIGQMRFWAKFAFSLGGANLILD